MSHLTAATDNSECVCVCVREDKQSLRAGFEPARGNPIGFQVQRLNHSAITAVHTAPCSHLCLHPSADVLVFFCEKCSGSWLINH